jgi:hypothetical protein
VGDLEGSESRRLLDADAAATYVPSGHLVFGREGTLFAQAFDADRLVLTGNPFRVAARVAVSGWSPALSASATGTLVYRVGSGDHRPTNPLLGIRPLIWFDRSGKEVGKVGAPDPGARPSLAPDGRQVAVFRSADQGLLDIWLIELDRDVLTRFTSKGGPNVDPIWSPDGREIAFSARLT